MLVNVVLFAAAKEVAGADQLPIELTDAARVIDLKEAIVAKVPELKTLVAKSVLSIDHQYAADDDLISVDAEVALIPPVSGG